MNALAPHAALVALLTTGVGAAMIRMGLSRGLLVARTRRRCPSCGRLLQAPVCKSCTA